MNKHLIVLDLDGTLLTKDQEILPYTKNVLMEAKAQGHHVMIATGRPFRASFPYYQQLNLNTPIVNFNGALVHNPLDTSFEPMHSPVSMRVVHDVIDSTQKIQYENLIAEVKDDVYLHKQNDALRDIFYMGNPNVTIGNLKFNLHQDPTSLLIHATQDNVPLIRKHLQDVHAELVEHRNWGAHFPIVEIVRQGVNKAVGISKVANELDIPVERIIAFGDEDNDLEMIDYAGIGVAMGNGIDQLKSIANEVTLSHEEDGIGMFLADRLRLKVAK